jgi:hypothetical protein
MIITTEQASKIATSFYSTVQSHLDHAGGYPGELRIVGNYIVFDYGGNDKYRDFNVLTLEEFLADCDEEDDAGRCFDGWVSGLVEYLTDESRHYK